MPSRALNRCRVLIRLKIGVDEFDETVDILDSNLASVSNAGGGGYGKVGTHGLVLLVEVVNVTVQDLNEELH